MATKPFYLSKRSDGAFEVLAVDAPRGFRSAAASKHYAAEFGRWHARQEAEAKELTELLIRTSYQNRADIEAAIESETVNLRAKQLWDRWKGSLLNSRAVDDALSGGKKPADLNDKANNSAQKQYDLERAKQLGLDP